MKLKTKYFLLYAPPALLEVVSMGVLGYLGFVNIWWGTGSILIRVLIAIGIGGGIGTIIGSLVRNCEGLVIWFKMRKWNESNTRV